MNARPEHEREGSGDKGAVGDATIHIMGDGRL